MVQTVLMSVVTVTLDQHVTGSQEPVPMAVKMGGRAHFALQVSMFLQSRLL